jgi:NAD(P)-dependent dehydrogenase (short-subunit alcohol dehydrogenase family)
MTVSYNFKDQTVVVVGGTSGINRGIAECFARQGARVAVASRSQEKVEATLEALEALGAEAMGFVADVRQPDALKEGLGKVADRFGEFDVVVSGAAGNFPALANEMSANGFKAVVDIDLLGSFHVLQAVYPHLRKPGACIINISAPQALLPMVGQAHVCAAKAGVDMLTRCLAVEWGPEGIRVNSVLPGPIEGTEGMRRLAPGKDKMQRAEASVPLKRLGRPEDIGNACLFLASPLASYINGAIIPMDGGWSQGGALVVSESLSRALKPAGS